MPTENAPVPVAVRDTLISRAMLRAWLVPALLAALALAGCGSSSDRASAPRPPGGGAPPPAAPVPAPAPTPAILEFSADRPAYFLHEDAVLTARFNGGSGRIEPDIGEVQSDVPVTVRGLSGPLELTLVVTSAAGSITRKLALPVNYRNIYHPVESNFVALWHTANLLPNGDVMLVGGWRGGHSPTGEINMFDASHKRFRYFGSLRVARQYHRTVNLVDGRLLVTGGDAWLMAPPSAELIDPQSGLVEDTGSPIEDRSDHTATVLADGRVLLVGGIGSSENRPFGISDTAEIWDPTTGKFRLVAAPLSTARVGHAAHLLPDGRVLIVGGWTVDSDYVLAEIFDPATETFGVVPSPDNRVRMEHTTLQLGDGSVLVMGGGVLGEDPAAGLMPDRSVLRFFADGTGAEILPDLAEPRALSRGALGLDGKVYLFGGMAGWEATAQAEAYSPIAGSEVIEGLPSARYNHTVTRLKDGRFLIAGGENEAIDLIPFGLVYE